MFFKIISLTLLLFNFSLFAGQSSYDGHLISVKKNYKNKILDLIKTSKSINLVSVGLDHRGVYKVYGDISYLKHHKGIKHIEPNYLISVNSVPHDPYFEVSWGLENMGNNEPRRGGGRYPVPGKLGADSNIHPAWDLTKGSKNIRIAVIDTGIDYNHPDLKENIWVNKLERDGKPGVDDDGNGFVDDIHGYDFSSNDPDPMDDFKHGTHVAGIIAAKHNSIGLAGVMDRVELVAIKFMDKKGRGDAAGAIAAIDYAIKVGAQIHNNSWGMLKRSELVYDILKEAQKKNALVVVAAGNSYLNNDYNPRYPASFDLENIITVAAYNPENRLAPFSCFGQSSVDIAAPGQNIISTVLNGKYKVLSGTSMAAPYVAGALGLYLSLNPDASFVKVKKDLLGSVDLVPHLKGKILSEGRMNIGNFVQLAK